MAEMNEARIQDMILRLGEFVSKKMEELARSNDKKIDEKFDGITSSLDKNNKKIEELTSSLESLQKVTRRGFQGVEDTLGKVTRDQSTLNDTLDMLPREIQKMVAAAITQIVQAEVSKALAAQTPKMIEAVQQQLGKSPQNEGKESATQPNPTEKPAGERYADHEMVEKPMPRGIRKKLQATVQAFRSGATIKEIFPTESGMLTKFDRGGIGLIEDLKSGAMTYDVASENGAVHVLNEGGEEVKKATYRSDGQSSYGVVGHRANVVDKLDKKDEDGKGLTLEEKKKVVKQYRQEHPKGGGR